MNNDNNTFTTDSSPGEQAYERKVNATAAFIGEYLNDNETRPVWIDPKGDSDIQSPDTPAINPFDIDPISDNEVSDQ